MPKHFLKILLTAAILIAVANVFYLSAQELPVETKCAEVGEMINGVPGRGNDCCPGLQRSGAKEDYDEHCEYHTLLGSGGICLACGDGACDKTLENNCNCPQDCPQPNP